MRWLGAILLARRRMTPDLALYGPDTDMDTGKYFRPRGDQGPRRVVGY